MGAFLAAHFLAIALFLTTLLFLVRVLRERRAPSSTLAWALAIGLIPYVGIPFYLLFGGRKNRRLARRKGRLYPAGPDPAVPREEGGVPGLLEACGVPPPRRGNRVRMIGDGTEAYARLVELIEGARESLAVATFILGHDDVGRTLVDRLAARAAEGVQVRLLLDALGCVKTRGRFVDPLRRAGGEVGIFLPVLPLHRKWSANLRNHRKMMLVDGKVALVGGMNLARQYLGPGPDPRRWADACALVEGPAVADLGRVFATDWAFATGDGPRVPEGRGEGAAGGATVQVVASGPDVEGEPLHDAVLAAILRARSRVWIATPYFVPDEAMVRLLVLVARMGCHVRVVVPDRSNHALADLARGTLLGELAQAGAEVLCFEPGMLHSKLIVVDEEVGVLGSANMDMRSLYLNYELAVFLQSPAEVREVAAQIEAYAGRCRPWAPATGWPRGLAEDVARLFSPLL